MKLTESQRERVVAALSQIEKVRTVRQPREEQWNEYLSRYEAKGQKKTFPWAGAAGFRIPFGAIMLDSIQAKIVNDLMQQERVIGAYELSDETLPLPDPVTGGPVKWKNVVELLEEYMVSDLDQVGFKTFVEDLTAQMLMLGTCVPKVVWDRRVVRDIDENGKLGEPKDAYDNVRFLVPALSDIVFSNFYDSFDRIPFISHLYLARGSEMLARVETDEWDERVVRDFLAERTDEAGVPLTTAQQSGLQIKADEVEETGDSAPLDTLGEHTLCETWLLIDLFDTGWESRVLVDHDSDDPSIIFRVAAWPYENGKRPFCGPAHYIKRQHRLYGMGVMERAADIEELLTTNFQQAVDNVTIANTRIWLVNSASRGAMNALDRIYPNKRIPVEDPKDAIPMAMGEVYPSIFQIGNIGREYGERLLKVSDYTLGRESTALGSQGSATSTMALLQQTDQYFSPITRRERLVLDECVNRWFDYIIQYKPIERIRRVLGARAELLVNALMLPSSELKKRIGVRVAFSSSATTQEIQKQNETAKWSMLVGYYQQLIQTAQLRMQNPPLSQLIDSIVMDSESHMRRLLETYGENYNTLSLPSWQQTIMANPMVQQMSMMAMQQQMMGGGQEETADAGAGPESGA